MAKMWLSVSTLLVLHQCIATFASVIPSCNQITSFECGDRTCIHKTWKCDGEIDCNDGSDERGCTKFQELFSEPEDYEDYQFVEDTQNLEDFIAQLREGDYCNPHAWHKCSDGQCIAKTWICDGEHDCNDGSDEMDCKEQETSTEKNYVDSYINLRSSF